MTLQEQRTKAEAFRAMHRGPNILILPNAWDVASARIFEEAGIAAIATTSAGIAFTLGYPDGQKISRDEMLSCVSRIATKVKIPVTADVEAGYGDRPEDAALTARGVIEAGAVGLNLEDGTDDPQNPLTDLSLQLEKISAVRDTAQSLGVPLVLNARTDVFLLQVGEPKNRYTEAFERLARIACLCLDSAICLRLPSSFASCTIRLIFWPGRGRLPYRSCRKSGSRASALALRQCGQHSDLHKKLRKSCRRPGATRLSKARLLTRKLIECWNDSVGAPNRDRRSARALLRSSSKHRPAYKVHELDR